MRRESKIQKSIRLSPSVVEYVEQQEGRDFSAKLSAVLEEYMAGEERRQKSLRKYKSFVEHYESELSRFRDLTRRVQDVDYRIRRLESAVKDLEDSFSADG